MAVRRTSAMMSRSISAVRNAVGELMDEMITIEEGLRYVRGIEDRMNDHDSALLGEYPDGFPGMGPASAVIRRLWFCLFSVPLFLSRWYNLLKLHGHSKHQNDEAAELDST